MPKLLNTAYPAAFATVCFALGCALYRRASVASAVLRMSARSSSGVAAATLVGADRIASSIMPTIDFMAFPPWVVVGPLSCFSSAQSPLVARVDRRANSRGAAPSDAIRKVSESLLRRTTDRCVGEPAQVAQMPRRGRPRGSAWPGQCREGGYIRRAGDHPHHAA